MAALPTVGGSAGVWGSELTTWLLVGHNSDGSVTLDSVASDVQPLGTRAAGSAGLPADSGHVHAMPTLDQVGQPAGNIAMNSKKFTGMANGTASTDSATVGQIPAIDTTASDVQPPGISAAAGSSGKAADARHVHPVTGATGNAVASKTASYSVQSSDGTLLCNASGGAFTVTLPTAAGITGQIFRVKKTDTSGNAVTVATTSAQTIDSVSAKKLSTAMSEMTVQSDGANWWLVISPAPVKTYNVKHYGAIGDGTVDDTAAFNACISAITGTAAPASNTRVAAGVMYIPAGTYKVTTDLIIRSVQNFVIRGDGAGQTRLMPSGTSFTTAILLIDGSLDGVFEGFAIQGDGTEQVTDGIRLDWTTAAQRSTTGNTFRDIRIRSLKCVVGISLESNATRQLDGTTLENVVVNGGQTPNAWSTSGNWQKGIAYGSGSFGNIYDQNLHGVDVAQFYYGHYCNASGFALYGGQALGNAVDFFVIPDGQTTISNVQSQNSGQFLIQTSAFSPYPVNISDVLFVTSYLDASNNVIDVYGGIWNISNFTASNVQRSSAYQAAVINVRGASGTRPGVAILSNVTMYGAFASAVGVGSQSRILVQNYAQYDPATGIYAAVTQLQYYNGTSWSTPGNTTAPDIKFFTATGTSTWTKVAGAKVVDVTVMPGGSGGGSGRRGAAGTVRCGGGGGAAGLVTRRQFDAADVGATETVTVGAGGTGGAAVTVDSTNGNIGNYASASSFGTKLSSGLGGNPGAGGTSTTGAGGTGPLGTAASFPGTGSGASATGGAGVGVNGGILGAAGGPSGGGITSGDVANNGAAGGDSYMGANTGHGAAGVVDTTAPTSGTATTVKGAPGSSAGSGAASITTAAQDGANAAANTGAGGSGGGASLNGNNSGKGGDGGSGWVLVVTLF